MRRKQIIQTLTTWYDNASDRDTSADAEAIDWSRIVPFILLHLACLFVFSVGWSVTALVCCFLMYFIRMFAITAFYHRYFSHRAFRTSRTAQFIFAVIGASATQRGPLWWAAHHRHHHIHSDTDLDVHSPKKGFLWSHMGWFLSRKHFQTQQHYIKDLIKYPELLWLDRFDLIVPILTALLLFIIGECFAVFLPELNTNGWQLLVWGYFVSTILLIHATLSINSLAHQVGSKPFPTKDNSRNNWLLALITLGEGWHNNHHFAPGCARQGFSWWQLDISYYLLKCLNYLGIIWELKPIPMKVAKYQHQLQQDRMQ